MKNSAKGLMMLLAYLQKHWFKAAFMSILLYLFIQKDFRFSINLNTPNKSESIEVKPEKYQPTPSPKKEVLTDRGNKEDKILDKFELPSLFGSSNKYHPMSALKQVEAKVKHDYMKRFARVVINERRKYGIPSSIILAAGLLQSKAGTSEMAQGGNNHFAIPCTLGWEGESGDYHGACYRHYENAWTSFRDHSMYLTSGKFAQLTTLDSTDYHAWAKGLEELNYGEGIDNLAQHLVQLIETYGLAELDRR